MSKQRFALALFIFSFAVFLWMFSFFFKSFVVASLLVMSTYIFAKKLDEMFSKVGAKAVSQNREFLTACVLTFGLGVLLFGPAGYAIINLFGNIPSFGAQDLELIKTQLLLFVSKSEFLGDYLQNTIANNINTMFSADFWMQEAKTIFSGAGDFLSGLATSITELALVVVFFFLLHWFKNDIVAFIKPLFPLDENEKILMAHETISAISVVFLALLGIMLAQGFAFFVLMLFFDYNAVTLGFFAGLSSVVPIFGTALVWIPVAVLELIDGNLIKAIIIAAYSWFVMAFLIDNFLRLFLLNKVTKLLKTEYKINEFLLFFSIAAGIAAFGFWGFIIGPSITALFLSSARLYVKICGK